VHKEVDTKSRISHKRCQLNVHVHVTKIYEGLELHLHALLTPAIDGYKWSIPRYRHFISWERTQCTHSIGDWVGSQSRSGSLAGNKNILPPWGIRCIRKRKSKRTQLTEWVYGISNWYQWVTLITYCMCYVCFTAIQSALHFQLITSSFIKSPSWHLTENKSCESCHHTRCKKKKKDWIILGKDPM